MRIINQEAADKAFQIIYNCIGYEEREKSQLLGYPPSVEYKQPKVSQESASDTHQERLELCTPSDNTEQNHLYS